MYNCVKYVYICVIVSFILSVSVGFKTSGRCLLKGGKYVARTTLFAFHFTVILLSRVNDKDKQQVYGCIWG